MFKTLKKTLFLCVGGAALMLAPACGDDGGGNDTPDANVDTPDAEPDEPDAEVPPANFSGTIAVTEVAVSNAEGQAGAVSGAVMSITYTNPDDVVVAPVPGFENNVGACRIVVYDASSGEAEPPESDGGDISITGTNAGDFGCSFNDQLGDYLCQSVATEATGALPMTGTSLTGNNNGTSTLIMGSTDFTNFDPEGMQIQLAGFADEDGNGLFGVIAKIADNPATLVIQNGDLVGTTTLGADSTYATFVGAGPIAGGYDFLDDGTNDVTITKGAEDRSPAVDSTLKANGSGVVLMSPRPHEIPVDGSGFSFACTGNCGTAEGALKGIIISGITTDGDLTDLAFNEMPAPVNSFATFQCSGIAAESIELSQEAMGHILGTNPTRIQTTVTYVGGVTGATNIIVGHGEVGFQDVADPNTPPPK